MASPGSTGTSLGDSSGNLASTDTSGGSGMQSPSLGTILPLSVLQGISPSPPLGAHFSQSAPLAVNGILMSISGLGRPVPGSSIGSMSGTGMMCQPMLTGSFGLAPTPPPLSEQLVKCPLCLEPFREPKVLACFHSFCKPCLERQLDSPEKIICPQCHAETQLCVELGIESLLNDYGLESVLSRQLSEEKTATTNGSLIFGSPSSTSSSPGLSSDGQPHSAGTVSPVDQNSNSQPSCTGCKSGERASAFCQDCSHFLCTNCNMAHQYMHCFDGHRVQDLSTMDSRSVGLLAASVLGDRPVKCLQHRTETLRYFCFTCNIALCRECTVNDHPRGVHQYEPIADVADKQMAKMEQLITDARAKQRQLVEVFKTVDSAQNRLNVSFSKAQSDIEESARSLLQLVDDNRRQLLKELENGYSAKQLQLTVIDKKVQQMTDKLSQTVEFTSRLLKYAAPAEVMVFKQLLETRLQVILSYNPDVNNLLGTSCELDFSAGLSLNARQAVAGALGHVRGGAPCTRTVVRDVQIAGQSDPVPLKPVGSVYSGMPPTPIGRPPSRQQRSAAQALSPGCTAPAMPLTGYNGAQHPVAFSDSNLLQPKHDFGGSSQSLGAFSAFSEQPVQQPAAAFHYEKWSSGGSEQYAASAPNGSHGSNSMNTLGMPHSNMSDGFGSPPDAQVVELGTRMSGMYPPRSQIKRQKMIYHCKFGEFGVMEGQFTEPSGVAVNAQNDIVVADTNNHRIQVFDKEGRFKFQFGECGKRDGQLLYPNRVAVNRVTGDFIVTERSPTHQIQVYNQYGQFKRKFGANILQHPRGVTVDGKGQIVVIECKVMRVIIFDTMGNVLQKFSCSRYLEFPNGVCTNDKQEIFISDNRAHCIKVFNYDGLFLRQLGGEGITNYPIGVGINALGEVVVADNHNNFNLTIFQQDGTMLSALESKVKHAQCFDVALVDDGSVVLASKDYRLYLYRYMQVPPQVHQLQ